MVWRRALHVRVEPVCLLAASYDQVVEALRYATSDLMPAEKDAVFGGNAVRVYGLTAI